MCEVKNKIGEPYIKYLENEIWELRPLSQKTRISQPIIARIEKCKNSPQTSTLIKLLYPMGYTIRVVPLEEVKEV